MTGVIRDTSHRRRLASGGRLDHCGAPKDEARGRLRQSFSGPSGTADIGMHDQRIGWAVRVFRACHVAALQAVFGVVNAF